MKNNLVYRSFLSTIRKEGKMIRAAIFMYSGFCGHYHLQGNDRTYSSLGAGKYRLWKAECDMHDFGMVRFHLRGGDDLTGGRSSIQDQEGIWQECWKLFHWEGDIQHSCL